MMRKDLLSVVLIFGSGILSALTPAYAAKQQFATASKPSMRRIAEIAAHLSEQPGVYGEYFLFDFASARLSLDEPIPDCSDELYLQFTRTGNRSDYEDPYTRRLWMLVVFAKLAAEGNGEAAKKTIEVLDAICRERSWVMPAHDGDLTNFKGTRLTIDLGSSERAYAVARALRMLGDKVPQELAHRARSELERRIFKPYRETNANSGNVRDVTAHGIWWFYCKSNWAAVCHAGVVRAALAVIESKKERAAFIEAAERGMAFFLESFLDDGYCTEGTAYWNYGFGHFLELTGAVKEATGGVVDFSRMGRAKEAMHYAFSYRLTDRFCPVFADGGGGGPVLKYLTMGAEFWPEYKPLLEGKLPIRSYFPNAQVFIGRAPRMAFGIKGGNNGELHNHNDIGSWTMIADGVEIAGDPGGEIYTRRTFSPQRYESKVLNSYGHPVPVIDNALQTEGVECAAVVVSTNFTDKIDEVAIDITGGYGFMKERKLGTVIRKVAFNRSRNSVAIVDEANFKRPLVFESAISTYADVEKRDDGKSFVLVRNGVRVLVQIGAGKGMAWHLKDEEIPNEGRPSFHRLAVKFDEPVKDARVGWRFTLPD